MESENKSTVDFLRRYTDEEIYTEKWIFHLNKAIAALEKQIPKTPDYEGDGYADGQLVYDTWICPNCEKHYEVDYDYYDYCPNCGQRLSLRH